VSKDKPYKYPIPLHRIGYQDADTGKHYVFFTNNFNLSAKTVADIYKSRWQR
jgi:IS4 transposase